MLRVVGIGSRLSTDDAVGLVLVQELAGRKPEPPGCSFELWEDRDALDLAGALLEHADDAFLVVDCAAMGLAPGSGRLIRAGEAEVGPGGSRLSVHGLGPAFAIELARGCGFTGEVSFFGIEPFDLEPSPGLSPAMRRRCPALLAQLEQAVTQLTRAAER